jgi:hypothetical protein
LRAQGAPAVGLMRPGLSVDEIDSTLAGLGFEATDDVRTWWGWHDGLDRSVWGKGRNFLTPGNGFFPLESAVVIYRGGREEVARHAERFDLPPEAGDRLWRPEWLPVLKGSGPNILLADCAPTDEPTLIRLSDPHMGSEGEPVAAFREMVERWIHALDVGAWRYDPEKGWQEDRDVARRERARMGRI